MRKLRHEKAILNKNDKLKIRTKLNVIQGYIEKIEDEAPDSITFICYARGIQGEVGSMLEVYEKRILKDEAKKEKKRNAKKNAA